ncbi:MAG: PAS domain S-box protein, partial [Gammaproteobacteria bacterium]|nr:PAS domain S-box protein [Gammaproteobacteria bacterium]
MAPKISGAVGYLSQVQEDHLRDFQQYATPHQRNTYQQLMAGSALEEVVQMRDQFLMRMDKVSVLGRLRGQIGYGGMIYLFKNLVLRKDEGLFPQIHALHQQAQKSIIEFRSLKGVTTVELEALSQIEQALAQYHQKVEQLGELIGRGVTIDKMDQALRVNDSLALQALATLDQQVVKPSGDAHTWFESATSRIEQVSGVIDVLKNQLQDQVQIKAREARWVFLYHQLFQFSMILLSALVAIYLARVLLRSVQRSVDSIRKIDESGDFSIRIAVECQDEVGQMGEALNRLFRHQQQAIGDAIRVSAEVAAGRFGQKIEAPYHGDLAQLKQGINGSVERVEQNTQTLMNQNSEMEQILSSMDQGLIVSDLEGVVQRVNPKVEQLTGLFSEELLGQEWKGMVLEEDLSLDGMDGVLSAVDQVSNLIQSFESLKMLCEETLTAALVINPQGEIMVANSQMAWISGWPTDELTKRHFEV